MYIAVNLKLRYFKFINVYFKINNVKLKIMNINFDKLCLKLRQRHSLCLI